MKIIFLQSKDWELLDKDISTKDIRTIVRKAVRNAAKALEYDPIHLDVVIKPNLPYVRKVTGVGGSTFDGELFDVTFDPTLPYGREVFDKYMADGVFHEMSHVRYEQLHEREDTILFWIVLEGLAVVFEREYAQADHPWNEYEADTVMEKWLVELAAAPDQNEDKWYFNHPDGRKNMVYKTGAWIVDRAIRRTGLSVVELHQRHWKEVVDSADARLV